jgi:hypothetical protein
MLAQVQEPGVKMRVQRGSLMGTVRTIIGDEAVGGSSAKSANAARNEQLFMDLGTTCHRRNDRSGKVKYQNRTLRKPEVGGEDKTKTMLPTGSGGVNKARVAGVQKLHGYRLTRRTLDQVRTKSVWFGY